MGDQIRYLFIPHAPMETRHRRAQVRRQMLACFRQAYSTRAVSDVQVLHVECIILDEFAARLHIFAH